MGQAVCYGEGGVRRAFDAVVAMGESLFGSGEVYVERYVAEARHVEVQVFGDGKGTVVALGTRDCSVQRRRQKVIEEAGSSVVAPHLATALRNAAARLCAGENYGSAGTVEFIVDANTDEWFFLEVNTRLQVEHCVTEMVTGIDLVRWMLLHAGGVDVLEGGSVAFRERGCAIEARVYAENPVKDYAPCPGVLSEMTWPQEGARGPHGATVRVDAWARRGTEVTSHYDPLLGKVIVWGRTRAVALEGMRKALEQTIVRGVAGNVELLRRICDQDAFVAGRYTTALLDGMDMSSRSVEVIAPGLQTSLQDYPGRLGYWSIGVSPSGAMDSYAMGLANALVGNELGAAAVEITMLGPTLKFHCSATIALTGARLGAEIDDGKPVPWWTPIHVEAGSVLCIESPVDGTNDNGAGGKLAYLGVRGGFDVPPYLGSKSTFPTGKFGGLHGEFLKAGDFLPVGNPSSPSLSAGWPVGEALPPVLIPCYSEEVTVAAINGPHGSEDFLHAESLAAIWESEYKVHHAANRLGVRLIGPTPKWTRADGGSAGLHPSNLHDYTYAPGAVNFSGNTPIVLMMDGPSLGGFVCPVTVSTADLWKVAQARPGATVRFKQVPYDASKAALSGTRSVWDAVRYGDTEGLNIMTADWGPHWAESAPSTNLPAVAALLDPSAGDKAEIKATYRMSGDQHVLVEYGEIELDLAYRMRVHMLMEELKPRSYVMELCPGVRSLLIKYDLDEIHVEELLEVLKDLEVGVMGSVEDVVVPSRIVRLPLSFDDQWTREAQQRYLRSVRPDAPYMPSNVEFVRRINGLDSVEEVKKIMTECEYCILGLGDVYLSAPCALPVDPRHRLVTSKYNPARTYTPEGGVGIGGAYMCIYGMDSPGGYQLCGRTLPIWDNYGNVPEENRGAPPSQPWFLRFFDRVSYFAVTDDELDEMRSRYRRGDLRIEITEDTFSFKEYLQFCEKNKESIESFSKMQQTAFVEERSRWEESGEAESDAAAKHAAGASAGDGIKNGANTVKKTDDATDGDKHPPFSVPVLAGVAASVWSVDVADGDFVARGRTLVTLESMKVEISVEAPIAGVVRCIHASKGDSVGADREICVIVSSQEQAMADLGIDQLRRMYKLGLLNPSDLISEILAKAKETKGVFVELAEKDICLGRISALSKQRKARHMPLYGVPFVVSDDIDVAGLPTKAGCEFALRNVGSSSPLVAALEAAGAILVGKTTMDALGAGATGVQSFAEVAENPVSPGQICGGASGSAVAVAKNFASFALAIDSAGNAVASAALVDVIGIRTTEGLLSLTGTVPKCPSLDSVCIFASTVGDVKSVLDVSVSARSIGKDLSLRNVPGTDKPSLSGHLPLRMFSVGVPSDPEHLQFSEENRARSETSYHTAVQRLVQVGGKAVEIDFAPFAEISSIFDAVPLDAARAASFVALCKSTAVEGKDLPASLSPSVVDHISRGERTSAGSLTAGYEKARAAQRVAELLVWSKVDVLAVPSVAGAASVSDARSSLERVTEEVTRFSRFVPVMDLCSVMVGGLTLIAPAMHEADLLSIASMWKAE